MEPSARPATPSVSRRETWILVSLCALALGLRCVNLNSQLWYDEILTVVDFVRAPFAELVTNYSSLNNHVFFSIQAHAALCMAGEHPWVVRLPAVVFGTLCVWALWDLARAAKLRPSEPLLSALLLTVSSHHIWFSQNARGYTGLVFWSWLASATFIRHFAPNGALPFRAWVTYALCVAAASYTHLSAVFLFAAHAATLAIFKFGPRLPLLGRYLTRFTHGAFASESATPDAIDARQVNARLKHPLLGLALGALFTFLLHAPMIPQMASTFSAVSSGAKASSQETRPDTTGVGQNLAGTSMAASAQPLSASPADKPLTTERKSVTSQSAAPTNPNFNPNAQKSPFWTLAAAARSLGPLALALPVLLLVLGVGGLNLLKTSPSLTVLHVVHIPLTFLILLLGHMRIWPRYFLVDIGFIIICAVRGIAVIVEWTRARFPALGGDAKALARSVTVTTVGVAGLSCVLLPRNFTLPKQDFESALRLLELKAQGDSVGVVGLAITPYTTYFGQKWPKIETTAQLEDLREAAGATWIVYSFPSHARSRFPEVMAVLDREFTTISEFPASLADGEVIVLRSEQ